MDNDPGTVIQHVLFARTGVRKLRVIRPGPIDPNHWMQLAIADGADPATILTWTYEERELGMHHLWLWWKEQKANGNTTH